LINYDQGKKGETTVVKQNYLTDAMLLIFHVHYFNNELRDIEVPLHDLIPDSSLLLPRPYPASGYPV